MSFRGFIAFFPLLCFMLCGCTKGEVAEKEFLGDGFYHISPQEARDMIEIRGGEDSFVILDVRTPEEFSRGGIDGAVNMDFYGENFDDELAKLDKDKVYLIYCARAGRSRIVLDKMREMGFREAYNMLGGIAEWEW